jgi:hypothetical protein
LDDLEVFIADVEIATVSPETAHVTMALTAWRGGYVIPSGEVRPGIRLPESVSLKNDSDPAFNLTKRENKR